LAVLILLCLAWAVPAAAQVADISRNPEAAIAEARANLHGLSVRPDAAPIADADIQARLAAIPPIQAKLTAVLASLTPRLQDLQARQAQLGQPPANGQAEDPQLAQTRRNLARALAGVTADVKEARLLSLAADQASASLSDRLRENFSARLWTRTRSILDPGLWSDFAAALPSDLARLTRAASAEVAQAGPAGATAIKPAIGALALLLCLFILAPVRVFLIHLGYRRAARGSGASRPRRLLLALWLVVTGAATPLVAGVLLRAALLQIHVLTPEAARMAGLLIQVTVFAALLESLGRALFSPGRPEWRIAPVREDIVRRLAPFPGLIGLTAALSTFVVGLNTILGTSLASRVASDCVSVLIELAAVGGALAAVGRARVARMASAPAAPSAAEAESRIAWVLATLAAWAAVAAALIAVVVGYLALATFLMRETVWVVTILAVLSILLRLADDLFPSLLRRDGPLGGNLETALGLSHGAMDQIGVLLSGITRLLLLLLAWIAMLAPFGAGVGDLFQRFTATDFVLHLGLVSISPGAVLGGLILFLVGLAITRGVRRWFEVRYLPKTALDVGVRTSLATGVTYLGGLVAVLVAFAYLGLSVAQIALFASALSVGIGFGLQAIISNFVSGLILLAERPVRVGDWIAIGDLEGDVRKISIRATEIEMSDHSRLIVPNSDLVSKTVRNITHSGAIGRVRIVLKVDGAADPDKVRDILLARMGAHPQVIKDPAPGVYLTDVRDGGMEFTALAYVISPRLAYGVKSELLFQIVPDLKTAGIALASQATVVNLGLSERLIEPSPPAS
jgi:small-conductance mechanosensitive channel